MASSPPQAERAMRSLLRAEVHVPGHRARLRCAPAEWQEAVKCRGTIVWEPWLDEVIATGKAGDRRCRSWR